ncbi:MAG: hypothetical protein V3T05_05430, partial [Myxococcota bacterium]
MMYRKEVNERSPLRILERSIHGGLGCGNLGVVMARAGVGKTAFLVQVGLDDAMRERPVLHIAMGQSLDHVRVWYDALFEDMATASNLKERESARAVVNANRVIQALSCDSLSVEHLEKVVQLYEESADFHPQALIIDGFDWESPADDVGPRIGAFKELAARLGAELWMSAQTHREVTESHPTTVTPPCDPIVDRIDVAVFLEPKGEHVRLRLLKDHDESRPFDTHLLLNPDTLRLVNDGETPGATILPASAHILLSGGARGAEACFGAIAERFGLREVTFTFAGRVPERTRGLVELNAAELQRGAVSGAYVKSQLHRTFSQDEAFQRILHSIWHQVATAGEVFVVGEILEDGTIHGGTGWGADLARHFK